MKILRLNKQEKILEKREEKMIRTSLNSLDKLNKLEAYKQKKREEKTRRESQLLSEISAPTDTPQVYSLVNLSNPFENPDSIILLANYDPLDPL
jgi:hypothetical protein